MKGGVVDQIRPQNIFFLLFDYVEVLDFAGSFDVFSMANLVVPGADQGKPDYDQGKTFRLYTVSEKGGQVTALHGLKVEADYCFKTCPLEMIDVLIIPGASTTIIKDFIEKNPRVIEWLSARLGHVPVVASVCIGALILAAAGGFDGLKGMVNGTVQCTTHHAALDDLAGILKQRSANARVIPGVRYVDNPKSKEPRILSSAGVSAGIDQAFYMLREILANEEVAARTANIMEYNQTRNWFLG